MQDSVLPQGVGQRKPHITPYSFLLTSYFFLLSPLFSLLLSYFSLLTLYSLLLTPPHAVLFLCHSVYFPALRARAHILLVSHPHMQTLTCFADALAFRGRSLVLRKARRIFLCS